MQQFQHKTKICNGCNTPKLIWKSHGRMKYCRNCWYQIEPPKVPAPSKVRIAPRSKKQSKLETGYRKLRELFFKDPKNHVCKARLYGCSYEATDVHHTRGRGIYMIDVSTWLPVCRSCHEFIELHPTLSKELGLSELRLTQKKINETLPENNDTTGSSHTTCIE